MRPSGHRPAQHPIMSLSGLALGFHICGRELNGAFKVFLSRAPPLHLIWPHPRAPLALLWGFLVRSLSLHSRGMEVSKRPSSHTNAHSLPAPSQRVAIHVASALIVVLSWRTKRIARCESVTHAAHATFEKGLSQSSTSCCGVAKLL